VRPTSEVWAGHGLRDQQVLEAVDHAAPAVGRQDPLRERPPEQLAQLQHPIAPGELRTSTESGEFAVATIVGRLGDLADREGDVGVRRVGAGGDDHRGRGDPRR
jgi:hypothetical protein